MMSITCRPAAFFLQQIVLHGVKHVEALPALTGEFQVAEHHLQEFVDIDRGVVDEGRFNMGLALPEEVTNQGGFASAHFPHNEDKPLAFVDTIDHGGQRFFM